jgi:hypothetical protein
LIRIPKLALPATRHIAASDTFFPRLDDTGPVIEIEEYCNGVVQPITKETITHYRKLIKDPLLRNLLLKAMSKELYSLAQGCTGITKGINTIFFFCTLTFATSQAIEQSPTMPAL